MSPTPKESPGFSRGEACQSATPIGLKRFGLRRTPQAPAGSSPSGLSDAAPGPDGEPEVEATSQPLIFDDSTKEKLRRLFSPTHRRG